MRTLIGKSTDVEIERIPVMIGDLLEDGERLAARRPYHNRRRTNMGSQCYAVLHAPMHTIGF